MKPTVISDISAVLGVTEGVIADTSVWVSRGQTPAGTYWALVNPANDQRIGVVAEHGGLYEAVIGTSIAHTDTAQDAALLVLAALHAPTSKDGVK
ncbi:hypothetical protein [Kitasatospora sp. NPDC051164]|uniref:hypothetical protein n=1 Tax=Kitasatospora sp. NPDC051164 TaxID=3364055 RepID=UPI0037B427DC